MGTEREGAVTDTPRGLDITWSPSGAHLRCRPLRAPIDLAASAGRALWMTGVLTLVNSYALIPLRLLDLVPMELPPAAIAAGPLVAMFVEALAALRRDGSEMVLWVAPGTLEIEHRLFGMHLITESFALDRVRRFELVDRRLVVSLRDAPARFEPLDGLSSEARSFVRDLLEDARQSGARFARAELARSADDEAAVERLSAISRTR